MAVRYSACCESCVGRCMSNIKFVFWWMLVPADESTKALGCLHAPSVRSAEASACVHGDCRSLIASVRRASFGTFSLTLLSDVL
jgi:hypothetical protein